MRASPQLIAALAVGALTFTSSACDDSDRCALDSDCARLFQICVERACVDRQRLDAGRPASDAGEPADAGSLDAAPADAGPTDAGEPPLPELPAAFVRGSDGIVEPGDYSCIGERGPPAGGSPVSFSLVVTDLTTGTGVPETAIELYADNVIPAEAGCADGCVDLMSDAAGTVAVTLDDEGWYAYRVPAVEGSVVRTLGYNRLPRPDPGTATVVSPSTLALFPSLLSRPRTVGTAVPMGTAVDCQGRPVAGVIVRVFLADGEEVRAGPASTDPLFFYFRAVDDLPDLLAEYTNENGLFGGLNVLPRGEPLRIEVWGRTEDEGPITRLGGEWARVDGDTVSIVTVGPLRAT